MSYPNWNYLRQAIIKTRDYEKGLEGGCLLLQYTEEEKKKLTDKEYENNSVLLYYFILDMLDKMDRWEDYIMVWKHLRGSKDFTLKYAQKSLKVHGNKIKPFISRKDSNCLYVHFLWTTLYRKNLIERKIEKSREEKKIWNLFHATKSELTEEEIQKRLDHIFRLAKLQRKAT